MIIGLLLFVFTSIRHLFTRLMQKKRGYVQHILSFYAFYGGKRCDEEPHKHGAYAMFALLALCQWVQAPALCRINLLRAMNSKKHKNIDTNSQM